MKTLYLLPSVVLWLFVQTPIYAQLEKAHFQFETESHDFGKIDEGPTVRTEFNFTNTGKQPLIISEVTASCGCTTPHWPKEPVMPGEKGKIVVEYNTKGRPGRFSKMVTITSNATEAQQRIFIKGEVIPAPPKEQQVKDLKPEEKPPNRPY